MDLTKIINKKDEAAQYMVDEITHICKDFEKEIPVQRANSRLASIWLRYLKRIAAVTELM